MEKPEVGKELTLAQVAKKLGLKPKTLKIPDDFFEQEVDGKTLLAVPPSAYSIE